MITVRGLYKKFGKLEALSNLYLDFEKGKSYAVIGPNGSGKTTLIKSILGLVIPDTGQLQCEGTSILNHWHYREKIGYMPQFATFPNHLKVGQLMEMMKDLRPGHYVLDEELIQAYQLSDISNKRFYTLSGGTRQKVSAALAFLFSPPILILDEPTAGLDPYAVEILKSKILNERTSEKLFMITSHIMSELEELTSEVAYLDSGKLRYAGSIEDLKSSTREARLGKAIVAMLQGQTEGTTA